VVQIKPIDGPDGKVVKKKGAGGDVGKDERVKSALTGVGGGGGGVGGGGVGGVLCGRAKLHKG